jgi:hypothetical protein
MLVNVPKLVTAYYTEAPDPSAPADKVVIAATAKRETRNDMRTTCREYLNGGKS